MPRAFCLLSLLFCQAFVSKVSLAASGSNPVVGSHSGPVLSVAVNKDGVGVSGGADGAVKLWNLDPETEFGGDVLASSDTIHPSPRTLSGHTGSVNSVGFSADGKTVVSGGSDGTVRLWGLRRNTRRVFESDSGAITAVAIGPKHRLIASGSAQGVIEIRRVSNKALLFSLSGHRGMVRSLVFDARGEVVVSGGEDGTLRVWDTRNGESLRTIEVGNDPVRALALVPGEDSATVLVATGKHVEMWDLLEQRRLETFRGAKTSVSGIAPSENETGSTVFAGATDGTLYGWEVETGKAMFTGTTSTAGLSSLALLPDRLMLFSGHRDSTLRLTATSSDAPKERDGSGALRSLEITSTRGGSVGTLGDGSDLGSVDAQFEKIFGVGTSGGGSMSGTLSGGRTPSRRTAQLGGDDWSIKIDVSGGAPDVQELTANMPKLRALRACISSKTAKSKRFAVIQWRRKSGEVASKVLKSRLGKRETRCLVSVLKIGLAESYEYLTSGKVVISLSL